MRHTLIGILLLLSTMMMIGCEESEDPNGLDQGSAIYTQDINIAPQFFSFAEGSFSSASYDLTFQSGVQAYVVALNSGAGVMAFGTDSIAFETTEIPAVGYAYDSTSFVIGDTWMDLSTYNPADHSISGNNKVYFIRSADYYWVKFRVISASPSAFNIEYALYSDETGFGMIQSKTVPYSGTEPANFSLGTGSVVEPVSWDVAFASTPEFSTELQTNFYMPTVLLNANEEISMGIVNDVSFEELDAVPSSLEWIMDTSSMHPFGNGGAHQIFVYHPEPPYNHQVIVENPELVYILRTTDTSYKIKFTEYSSGIIVFEYEAL